jgi:glyoxylate/hydroxypyruvate reductase A
MTQTKPHIYFNSSMDSADDWRAALATQFDDFTYSVGEEVSDPGSVDVAIVWTLPDAGLERFTNLRAILSLGAGVNQLDPKRLPAQVPLARLVDDGLTRMMVDYAKTAVFRYHRKFHILERRTRERSWIYIPPTLTSETSVGILGLGELGSEIALALRAEGFDVFGWSRTAKQLDGVDSFTGKDGLASVVRCSDIVLNILPLTEETHHILSRDLFAHFRDGTFLINMGRGKHLVDADLLEAIKSGKVGAATLDVATVEPLPEDHPFWNHPDILITPHVAGTSIPGTAVVNIAANIRKALAGEPLNQQVDRARGY